MTGTSNKLGIVAGGGQLPLAIAENARQEGREVFLVALEGLVDPEKADAFPHAWTSLGEFGKTIKLLKNAGCSEVALAGRVARPEISQLKLDTVGALALPRVMAAALKGDDALLRSLVGILEKEGLRVVGSDEAARDLVARPGPLGTLKPNDEEVADIQQAIRVVNALGALDIGQAAVVCGGLVLAVEAAEGTDAMLARVAGLPQALRGTVENRRGVMVKAAKPDQERRVDLPVIGPTTVERATEAGLAGIAFEAGATLLINRAGIIQAADGNGLFAFGIPRKDFPRG